jgi:hypothetical protein
MINQYLTLLEPVLKNGLAFEEMYTLRRGHDIFQGGSIMATVIVIPAKPMQELKGLEATAKLRV